VIIDGKIYRELRCNNCRKFIIWEYTFAGRSYYKCPRCGEENVFTFKHYRASAELKEFEFDEKSKKVDLKGGE